MARGFLPSNAIRAGRALWLLAIAPLALGLAPDLRAGAREDREMASGWRSREVRIDGVDEEWRDLTVPVKGQRFAVGFLNDDRALYFCLVTKDRVTTTQIERQGLMVWLDRPGDKKRFGIHYPIGIRPRAPRRDQPQEPGEGRPPVGPGQAEFGSDLAILGPGANDGQRVPIDRTGGIEVAVGVHGDLLVYEMKVPLEAAEGGPYTVKTAPGGAIRLGLRTPDWRGPAPFIRRPGGIAIGIGVGPRGGFGYPPMDSAMLKPLDVAATLRLAAAPAGDPQR